MGIIAPPQYSGGNSKKLKVNQNFLKDALLAKTREIVTLKDGSQMAIAQAMADGLVSIAMNAESNSDRIQAYKLIFERLYGKAAVEKIDETKEMPKIVFALRDSDDKEIREAAKLAVTDEEFSSDDGVIVTTDDGKEFIV